MTFDREQMVDDARHAARRLAQTWELRHVYLGGALLAGLGSPMSDIDVFVVVEADDGVPPGLSGQHEHEGNRVDVEILTFAELDALAADLTRNTVRPDDLGQLIRLPSSRFDVAMRLLTGELVVDVDERLAGLRGRLLDEQDTVKRLLVARHALDAGNALEDADGFCAIGQFEAARHQAFLAVLAAAEGYLTTHGDWYVGPKWVWSRWDRTLPGRGAGVREVLRGSTRTGPPDGKAVAVLRAAAQDLLVWAISGREYDVRLAPAPGTYAREPFLPIPLADGFVLGARSRGFELTAAGVLLWGVSHGRTADEAVDAFFGCLPDVSGRPARADVERLWGRLNEKRAIVPHDA